MRRDEFVPLIGLILSIGVPHFYDTNRVFWHTGQLSKVYEDSIVIRKSNGEVLEIPLNEIQLFKRENKSIIGFG